MAEYSGTASIMFYVEREGEELELEVYGRSYFRPGKISGLPENCYPDEGETEILKITLDGNPWDGNLTDKEIELAESQLTEAVCEDAEEPEPPSQDDFDDYDDYDRYDDLEYYNE